MSLKMGDEEEVLTVGERFTHYCGAHYRGILIFLIPTLSSPLLFLEPHKPAWCGWILVVMAAYWITECIPLGITAVIPIVAFPCMGILNSEKTCLAYFTDSLILFFGGLVVALSIEFSGLHRRVALNVILVVGCSPRKLHLSLMLVSMFVSMWISNAATTAMMCPLIKSVLEELNSQGMAQVHDERPHEPNEPPFPSEAAVGFYLGVAYASSIGGTGTLIGTGTNLVFKGIYDKRFPDAGDIEFGPFMIFTVPPMLLHTFLVFFAMQIVHFGMLRPNSAVSKQVINSKEAETLAREVILERHKELGPMTCHEIQIGLLFLLMIALFLTRKPGIFKGWADVMNAKAIKSSMPMILIVVLIFMLPVNYTFMKYFVCAKPEKEGSKSSLITWGFVNKNMPWNMLLLLGGGFALSAGMSASGLAVILGDSLVVLKAYPHAFIQLLCIIAACFGTAFTANMAMCNILIPVMNEMAIAVRIHPAYLGLPATLALSMAFHFPVSTPANAIVGGYASIRTPTMFMAAIPATLITCTGIFIFSQTYAMLVFEHFDAFPPWAEEPEAPEETM